MARNQPDSPVSPPRAKRPPPAIPIIVSGGAGYIGSHVVRAIGPDAPGLVVVDDFSSGHRNALPARCDVRESDITTPRDMPTAGSSPSALVHLAATIDSAASVSDPGSTFPTNVSGSIALLNAAVRGGVRYAVFCSTASVYGASAAAPSTQATAGVSPCAR